MTFAKEKVCPWLASLGRRGRRGRHTAAALADVVDLLVERSTNGHELCGVALLCGLDTIVELVAQVSELEENVVDGGR